MDGGIEGLEVQVENVMSLISTLRTENKGDHQEIKAQLDAFNGRLRTVEVQSAAATGLDERVGDNEIEIAKIQERQKWYSGIPTALAVIGSALATWLGTKQ